MEGFQNEFFCFRPAETAVCNGESVGQIVTAGHDDNSEIVACLEIDIPALDRLIRNKSGKRLRAGRINPESPLVSQNSSPVSEANDFLSSEGIRAEELFPSGSSEKLIPVPVQRPVRANFPASNRFPRGFAASANVIFSRKTGSLLRISCRWNITAVAGHMAS